MENNQHNKDFKKIWETLNTLHGLLAYETSIQRNVIWDAIQAIWIKLQGDGKDFVQPLVEMLCSNQPGVLLRDVLHFLPFKSETMETFRVELKKQLSEAMGDQSRKEQFLENCLSVMRNDNRFNYWMSKMIEEYHNDPEHYGIFWTIIRWNFFNVQSDAVRIKILEILLDQSKYHHLFWKAQKLLLETNPVWWEPVICKAVAAKSRGNINVLRQTEQEGQEIIRLLTKKYCDDPDEISGRTATRMTIMFFCELTSPTPRKQLMEAWKKLSITGLKRDDLIQLQRRLDDDMPNREQEGPIVFTMQSAW